MSERLKAFITDDNDLHRPVHLPNQDVDISEATMVLAINLGLAPKPSDVANSTTASGNDVPNSLAIIEAGETQVSKVFSRLVAAVGGLATAGAAAASFWHGLDNSVRIALLLSLAGVLAASMVAIAVIVSSDVKARGQGSAAQYAARATVVDAYLESREILTVPPSALG